MNISTFISGYTNYPVLFIGTGLTLRYLKNSYSWDSLLKKIAFDITGDEHYYLDIKSKYMKNFQCNYAKIATDIEADFNKKAQDNQQFNNINELFYINCKDMNEETFNTIKTLIILQKYRTWDFCQQV